MCTINGMTFRAPPCICTYAYLWYLRITAAYQGLYYWHFFVSCTFSCSGVTGEHSAGNSVAESDNGLPATPVFARRFFHFGTDWSSLWNPQAPCRKHCTRQRDRAVPSKCRSVTTWWPHPKPSTDTKVTELQSENNTVNVLGIEQRYWKAVRRHCTYYIVYWEADSHQASQETPRHFP